MVSAGRRRGVGRATGRIWVGESEDEGERDVERRGEKGREDGTAGGGMSTGIR